jgi:hypothetical protein
LSTIARIESTKVPIDRGKDEENMAHVHSRVLFIHRMDKILSFVITWMELVSEISQTQKDKSCMISFMCGVKENCSQRSKEHSNGSQGLRKTGRKQD